MSGDPLLTVSRDPTSSHDFVTVIKDRRLAGCDGSLRFIEYYAGE